MSNGEDLEKTMYLAPSVMDKIDQKAPKAKLVCTNKSDLRGHSGHEILLEKADLTLGRGEDNGIVLDADGVSKHHARIFPGGDMWGIADRGSRNGVYVNNAKVKETWLKPGDTVILGKLRYRYEEIVEHTMAMPSTSISFERDSKGAETISMHSVAGSSAIPTEKTTASQREKAVSTAVPEVKPTSAVMVKTGKHSYLGLWMLILGVLLLGIVIVRAVFFT